MAWHAGYALELSDQIARFKEHTFDDVGGFDAILEQKYGATIGGAKGNKTLRGVDGLYKVQVQVADHIDFGPELQIAKGLVDECLNEWSASASAPCTCGVFERCAMIRRLPACRISAGVT